MCEHELRRAAWEASRGIAVPKTYGLCLRCVDEAVKACKSQGKRVEVVNFPPRARA
jgi:hypothetical protein